MPIKSLIRVAEKLEILPRSAMLTSRYRAVRSLGTFAFAVLMLLSVRRIKWFFNWGRIPRTRIECRAAAPVSDSDVQLCERLLAAHKRVIEHRPQEVATEGMWSWIFDQRQQDLARAVDGDDPRALAEMMASMFTEDFVLGMAPGPLIQQTNSRLGSRAWGLKCLDGLASLGELLGVVAVENPEQGRAGLAFQAGLDDYFTALEKELGFEIDFPQVGAAAGLAVGGRLVTPDTPDQIYAALRLDQAIKSESGRLNGGGAEPRIVEIGGGYGAMCYWFAKCRPDFASYTIVDLPVVNILQGYFLGRALGADRISLYGEPGAQIRIIPNFALGDVDTPFEILVNKDSMPEMPSDAMNEYLEWGAVNCTGLFYSYNQEAAMDFLGEQQGVVHKAVARLDGFERLRRERAWVREGYVEELYAPKG